MPLNRFWSKVDQSGDCWLWTGARISTGYGSFYFDGRSVLAHRFAYELEIGVIPEGMLIDHLCHNRGCVNPTHMRLATYSQNQENRQGAQSNSASGIRGVSWVKPRPGRRGKWIGQVRARGVAYVVGYFDNIEDAAEAVRLKRIELFTHNNEDRIST